MRHTKKTKYDNNLQLITFPVFFTQLLIQIHFHFDLKGIISGCSKYSEAR